MKYFNLLIVFTLFVSATAPTDQKEETKINWVDFNTGFAKSQEEGKIAIIDCYTDWCGWCKVMDKKTFSNEQIIERINEKYIPIKFNPEKPGKYITGGDTLTGRQLLLALSNNKPSGYPTFFFFVPQAKQMFQVPGYQDVAKFSQTLDNVERFQENTLKKSN